MDHADLTPSFTARGGPFVIFTQPAVIAHPGIRPFDHPAAGKKFELRAIARKSKQWARMFSPILTGDIDDGWRVAVGRIE
jgi:hypothetical protein